MALRGSTLIVSVPTAAAAKANVCPSGTPRPRARSRCRSRVPFVDSTRPGRTIDCAVERCASGHRGTVAYMPITFAPGLADGRVKRRSDGVIFGDDAYHLGPPLFEIGNVGSQHRSHAIEPGGYWTYAVQVQNDGLVTEDLIVTASTFTSSPGLPGDAQFFYGYFDLTSSVLGGSGLTFPDMAPGEVRTFAVRFHVPTDMPEGSLCRRQSDSCPAAQRSPTR